MGEALAHLGLPRSRGNDDPVTLDAGCQSFIVLLTEVLVGKRSNLQVWVIIDSNVAQEKADATYHEIEALKYRIQGLMDSFLYERVAVRAQVPDQIKMTNILANDSNYRNVSRLWMEWLRHGRPRLAIETLADIYRRLQVFGQDFDDYCLLLVIRDPDQLGLEPQGDALLDPICARSRQCIKLTQGVQLTPTSDGAIELANSKGTSMRIVPLPATLSSSEDALSSLINEILGEFASKQSLTVLVLHLSDQDADGDAVASKSLRKLQTVGNEPELGLPPNLGLMPVSPWEIDSVERVARAIRWWKLGGSITFYPYEVKFDSSVYTAPPTAWMRAYGETLTILRNPTTDEANQLGLQQASALAARELDRSAPIWTAFLSCLRPNEDDHPIKYDNGVSSVRLFVMSIQSVNRKYPK